MFKNAGGKLRNLSKTVLAFVLIGCMMFMSSCGRSSTSEKENTPGGANINQHGLGVDDGLTPTITPTPAEAENSYRFKIEKRYKNVEVSEGSFQYEYQNKTEYEYNSSGNVMWYDFYTKDGNLNEWHDYEYDSEGRKIKETIHYSENEWVEYEYDSEGRKIRRSDHGKDLVNELLTTYEQLDETGRTIKETNYSPKGEVLTWFVLTYDAKGRLLTSEGHVGEAYRGMEGYVVDALTETTEKEYDEYGKCIKLTKQYPDQEPFGETNAYERDEKGNVTRIFCNPFPRKSRDAVNCRKIEEYVYDSRGKAIEYKKYYVCEPEANMSLAEGPEVEYLYKGQTYKVKLIEWQKSEYDALGRKVKHEILRYDGIVETRYDYEYVNDLVREKR